MSDFPPTGTAAPASDTPRTDAAEYKSIDEPCEGLGMVDADFARTLERELSSPGWMRQPNTRVVGTGVVVHQNMHRCLECERLGFLVRDLRLKVASLERASHNPPA